jgi:hypothetical protein
VDGATPRWVRRVDSFGGIAVAIAVNIDSVTTADAAATTAPHKISKKATKETATFKFTITAASTIRAWRARRSPTNRNTGTLLGRRGMVCGSGDRCGTPEAFTLSMASSTQSTETTNPTELGNPADGAYEVKVFAMSEADGWST